MIEVPFPAVTICTMNEARKSNAEKIENSPDKELQGYKKLLKDYCTSNIQLDRPTEDTDDVKPDKHPPENWTTLLNYMTTVRQPCHEMILSCYFAGKKYDCAQIFNPTLSDEGICCAFNNVRRDFLYRNPRDLSDLNVTFPLPCVDWTPENGFPAGTTKGSIPWRPRGAGSHLGLTLVLDIEEEEFYCSTSASKGLKMLLHSPVESPKIADYGSLITGGREYRITISPKIMNSSETLQDIKEDDRQCIFSSEKELQFYRTYTQRNCILECEANYTLHACSCVPYYLPKNADTPICGRESETCTEEAKEFLDMVMVDKDSSKEGWPTPNCHCPRGCSELSYTTTMTYGSVEPGFADTLNYLPRKYNHSQGG